MRVDSDKCSDPGSRAFYCQGLTLLRDAQIPFLIGGAYVFERYTGIARDTKDLDIFVHPRDCDRVFQTLGSGGYQTDLTFPHWLGKAFSGGHFIDVIFSSGNGACPVDDEWFEHAADGQLLGIPVRFCPAEEIIWQKARGAAGSCTWGSFQSPANPVLRDLTERVIVASKGRFNRAIPRRERARLGLPSEASIFSDDFMEATTDLWEIPPESATRVGHPAPFPVELPQRLIELYTYRGDLVLDPFMGSGSTAIAALRTERHFVGYDTEKPYVKAALSRVAGERARLAAAAKRSPAPPRVVLPAVPVTESREGESFQSRAVREGKQAKEIARAVLEDCGFVDIVEDRRMGSGVEVNFVARDRDG